MRRFVMICMALMAAVSVRAVDLKTGSFGVLLGQSQVEVVFDFSSVVIDGMTLDDFKSGGRVDEDYENWDDFEVFIKRRFIAGLNRYHAKIPEKLRAPHTDPGMAACSAVSPICRGMVSRNSEMISRSS